jgi:hypothetical protein
MVKRKKAMKNAYSVVLIVGFILSVNFYGFTAQAMSGEDEEWHAPEEPRNETEKQNLEQTIREREQKIENEDQSKPDVQLELKKIDAEKAVVDIFNADQQLQANPNDAAAQEQRKEAQKNLQDALKIIDSILQGTFTPADGGKGQTVLQKFTSDFKNALQEKIRTLENSGLAQEAINKQELDIISSELVAMQYGKKSALIPDTDYSLSDYTMQKQVLNLLDRTVDTLDSNADKIKTLKQEIEDRIDEIDLFKPGAPLPDNALGQRLNLADKLPSDRLRLLKTEFRDEKKFKTNYKTLPEQQQAYNNLIQALYLYDIPFDDFFELNKTVSPAIIVTLFRGVPSDGNRLGVIAEVRDAANNATYFSQKNILSYLDVALQDPIMKQYSALADYIVSVRTDIKNRIDQITQYYVARKNDTLPQPPAGSPADTLKLSDQIPLDQITTIEKQYVKVNAQIQEIFKEQLKYQYGDNLNTWGKEDLQKLIDVLKPMQELLTQASELYNLNKEYGNLYTTMKDAIDNQFKIADQALNQPGIADTIIESISSFFKKSVPDPEPKTVAETISLTLDKLNDVVAGLLVKQGELVQIAAAGAEVVGTYMQQAPDLLEQTKIFIDDLEKNTSAHILGKTNLLVMEAGGAIPDRKVVENLAVSVFKQVKEFANDPVLQKIAEGVGQTGNVISGGAAVAQAMGKAVEQAGKEQQESAQDQSKLEAIKLSDALVKQERNNPITSPITTPREQSNFDMINKLFKSFAKNLSKWIRKIFVTDATGVNNRYAQAKTNYSTVRDQYLKYLDVSEQSTPEAIRVAIEKKATEDPVGSKNELQNMVKSLQSMTNVLTDAQKSLQAVQGNFKFVVDAWDSIAQGGFDQKASAADIVNEVFDMRNKKMAYLEAAQEAIKLLQDDISTTMVVKGSSLDTITDQFIAGLERMVTQNLVSTIDNYQKIARDFDDTLQEKKQELLQKSEKSSGATQNSSSSGVSWQP